jgi:hypothetical protein
MDDSGRIKVRVQYCSARVMCWLKNARLILDFLSFAIKAATFSAWFIRATKATACRQPVRIWRSMPPGFVSN